jgi:hypothetical protein
MNLPAPSQAFRGFMKTPILFLVLAATLSCIRSSNAPRVAVENDPSIVFPPFFAYSSTEVGAPGEAYVLDGATLQAIRIAIDDFLPPNGKERPCWNRPETQRYRVIRQGDIIFVRIDEDPEACGMQYLPLDTGVRYAISMDGRILKRLLDGEPEKPLLPEMSVEEMTPAVEPVPGPHSSAAWDGGTGGSPDGGQGGNPVEQGTPVPHP